MKDDKVICMRCKVCKCWEIRTKNKNILETWVHPGTKWIKKDSLKKHLASPPHKEAIDFSQREKLGVKKHSAKIEEETPIGKVKMNVYRWQERIICKI